MRNLFANDMVALETGHAISGIAEEARTLTVLSGRVWLTTEGGLDDHWLETGEEITLPPHRLVVLESDAGVSRVRSIATGLGIKRSDPWHTLKNWAARRFASPPADVCSGSKAAGCHAGGR